MCLSVINKTSFKKKNTLCKTDAETGDKTGAKTGQLIVVIVVE